MHPIDTKDKAQGLHNLTSGDSLEILCKGICYALSLCRVKALLGFQNLHAYGSYFGAKPCIDVHNTFLRHIISNKSRK